MSVGLKNALVECEKKIVGFIREPEGADSDSLWLSAKELTGELAQHRAASLSAGLSPVEFETLRAIAWLAQSKEENADKWHELRPALNDWLELLISSRLARRFTFLDAHRVSPSSSAARSGEVLVSLGELRDRGFFERLPFLTDRRWRRLSDQEKELALAVFAWELGRPGSKGSLPRFVWWLEDADDRVYDEIEDFLSRRYCYSLRHLFWLARKAQQKRSRSSDRSRLSMAAWRLRRDFLSSTRLGAFAGIGFIALASVDAAYALAFAAPCSVGVLGLVSGSVAVLGITYLDITSMNRGAGLPKWSSAGAWRCSAAILRALRTCGLYAVWVGIFLLLAGVMVAGMQQAGPAPERLWPPPEEGSLGAFEELVLPRVPGVAGVSWSGAPRFALGAVVFGVWVMLTGALLQWFWDQKSSIERM